MIKRVRHLNRYHSPADLLKIARIRLHSKNVCLILFPLRAISFVLNIIYSALLYPLFKINLTYLNKNYHLIRRLKLKEGFEISLKFAVYDVLFVIFVFLANFLSFGVNIYKNLPSKVEYSIAPRYENKFELFFFNFLFKIAYLADRKVNPEKADLKITYQILEAKYRRALLNYLDPKN